MTRVAWADLASGAGGDMIMSALVDAGRRSGAPVENAIRRSVHSLGDCDIEFLESSRAGLRCLVADVRVPSQRFSPGDLRTMILRADASDRARTNATAGLDLLIEAESRVHGISKQDVHLHDLGSADTAVDLVGASVAFESLGIDRVASAPVPSPMGWVSTQGGPLPVPTPATLEILRGAAMRGVSETGEYVTPSAAAILVAHGAAFGPVPAMVLREIGTGGGARDNPRPNVCRILIGDVLESHPSGLRLESNVLLETNIDDQTPESISHALASLMAAGAKDVWITPILMKKSRPAFQLSVLVAPEVEPAVLQVLFRQTTTLGTRRRVTEKWTLPREVVTVQVGGRPVRVKVGRLGADVTTVSPEYDDCARLATEMAVPLLDVYAEARAAARQRLGR